MPKLRNFSLLRNAAGTLGLKIFGAGIGFVNGILIARLLGPAEFGVYSIAISIANFTATLALVGLPILVTRETATNLEYEKWGKLKGFIRASHVWSLLATFIIICVSLILLSTNIVKLTVPGTIVIIAMVLFPILALSQLRAAILRGLHWVILADIPELLLRPITIFIFLIGIYFTSSSITAVNMLYIHIGAVILAFLGGSWLLISHQPRMLRMAAPSYPQFHWMIQTIPFFVIAIINMLQGQVALYMLGYFNGAEQAGLFQAANQFVALIVLGLVAVNLPLQPRLAAVWSRGDRVEAQRLILETAYMGATIAFVGALVLIVFADSLLKIYGIEYIKAATPLQIMAVGQLISAALGSNNILLLMSGHQRVVMWGSAFALIVNISIGYWAIPLFGTNGSAMASLAGIVSWNIYFTLYAFKRLNINTTVIRIKKQNYL